MKNAHHPCLVALAFSLFSSGATAQEFTPQRNRDAMRSAKNYLAGLDAPGKCPIGIDADPERAGGVVIRPDTQPIFLFVPQKGVEKLDLRGKEAGTGHGVPVGYLFGQLGWSPVVDGRLIEAERMRHTDQELVQELAGRKLKWPLPCLVLTAARKKDGGHVLHAFGNGEEPLFSMPLEEAGKTGTSLVVKDLDMQTLRLKLVLTLANGSRASIPFGTSPR